MIHDLEEHKNLFCKIFIETHRPFKPEDLNWPDLDDIQRQRLIDLPIWDYAVHTERQVHHKLAAYAEQVKDPVLKEAIALQAYEEGRHADTLRYMIDRYNLPYKEIPDKPLPKDLRWAFMRTGAGECIDSFFAFGFFSIARSSGEFMPDLVETMEPLMEEEARHILFYQNWLIHEQNRQPFWLQPVFAVQALWAYAAAGLARLQDIKNLGGEAFTLQAPSYKGTSFSIRDFLTLCLQENNRRLGAYDHRLERPKLVPRMVGFFRIFV